MISVIVPVYNVEPYLETCVDSLLQQKIDEPYEIVLVDDGSTDKSGELCDALAEKYDIVRAFHKENGGLSSARNYGITHTTGDKVTFVDSDDYVSEEYLSILLDLMNKYDADLSMISVILRYPGEEGDEKNRFEEHSVDAKQAFYEVYADVRVGWSACGKLFKREVLGPGEEAFPAGLYEDSASMYKFLGRCNRVAIGDYNTHYHYLRREGSITYSQFQKKHLRIFQVCDELAEYIDNTYPDLKFMSVMMYQNACEQLLNRLKMSDRQFNKIYYRYRRYFKKNFVSYMLNRKIYWKNKVYLIMLCSTPGIYKRFIHMLHHD